jgi:uncharacterized membrane protein
MGENHFSALPTALYGAVLLAAAIAYFILQQTIIASQGQDSKLRRAVGRDWKGKLSPVLYLLGIALSFINPWVATIVYVSVAGLWLIPDRRIERTMQHDA